MSARGLLMRNELLIGLGAHSDLAVPKLVAACARITARSVARRFGTTRRGIRSCVRDESRPARVRMRDLLRPSAFVHLWRRNLDDLAPVIEHLGGGCERRRGQSWTNRRWRPARSCARIPRCGASCRAAITMVATCVEGAQGCLLDLDHGTYPYVTFVVHDCRGRVSERGIGPTQIDTVVGITKAMQRGSAKVHSDRAARRGGNACASGRASSRTTGRPRRCGWLDLPALRMGVRLSVCSRLR